MINQGDRISISAEVIRVCHNGMLNVRLSDGQLVHIRADEVCCAPFPFDSVADPDTDTPRTMSQLAQEQRESMQIGTVKRGPGRPRKVLA